MFNYKYLSLSLAYCSVVSVLPNKHTHSMKHGCSYAVNGFSANQEILCQGWLLFPLVFPCSLMNPVHILSPYFVWSILIFFHLCLDLPSSSLLKVSPTKILDACFFVVFMPHVLSISLFSIILKYFARSTNVEASHYIQVCFFSVVSLLPVKSKYSLWYPFLKLPEFVFFAQCERLQVLHSYKPVAKIVDLCILMLHAIHTFVILLYLLSLYKNTWISAGNKTGIFLHYGTVGLKWCGKAVPVLDLCLAVRVINYRTLLQRWPEVWHRIRIQNGEFDLWMICAGF